MAAVITLSAPVVATDGKTITATIGGGTAPYSITNGTEVFPSITGLTGGDNFPVQSVGVLGTTLTITLYTPIGTGETARLSIGTGSNLTDALANTPVGQNNIAATNNSAVTVTVLRPNDAAFAAGVEINADVAAGTTPLRGSHFKINGDANREANVEFVTDATEVAFVSVGSNSANVRVDSAASVTPPTTNQTWVVKPLTQAPLAAGKHLIRFSSGDYVVGLRLSGGTRSIVSVPSCKVKLGTAGNGAYFADGSAIAMLDTVGSPDANGHRSVNTYSGARAQFGFTGTGVELYCTATNSGHTYRLDGAPWVDILTPKNNAGNVNDVIELVAGLTNQSHTFDWMVPAGWTANANIKGFRIVVGTKLSAAASIGDGTIQVTDLTGGIAVGHWLKIDTMGGREARQVVSIAGSGPYTLTLDATLAKAHTIGSSVTSYEAPKGSVSAWTDKRRSKRLCAMGDSNTQGSNEFTSTRDSQGLLYGAYDHRQSSFFLAAEALGYSCVNLGAQGQTSGNLASSVGAFSTYAGSNGGYDVVTIWAGTNDINGTSTTPATYKSNVQTMVTSAKAQLNPGGCILLMAPYTPQGTNAGGLNTATCLTALNEIAAADPSTVEVITDWAADLVGSGTTGDYDGVHYKESGRIKYGRRLQGYLVAKQTAGFFT